MRDNHNPKTLLLQGNYGNVNLIVYGQGNIDEFEVFGENNSQEIYRISLKKEDESTVRITAFEIDYEHLLKGTNVSPKYIPHIFIGDLAKILEHTPNDALAIIPQGIDHIVFSGTDDRLITPLKSYGFDVDEAEGTYFARLELHNKPKY